MEQRVIKFRALKDDMSNCNFVYGQLVFQCDIPMIKTSEVAMLYDTCIKGTVGQFTGLTDKNRVDIYEGDIVRHGLSRSISKIVFIEGSFALIMVKGTGKTCLRHYSRDEYFEIIGNIHTNPELLK